MFKYPKTILVEGNLDTGEEFEGCVSIMFSTWIKPFCVKWEAMLVRQAVIKQVNKKVFVNV